MLRAMVCAVFTVVLLLAGTMGAGAQDAASTVQVDAAVQVTGDQDLARGHLVPAVAVHPDDDAVLAIAEGDVASGACAVHISTDRGLSWQRAAAPEVDEPWTVCAYQVIGQLVDVTFGPDGTLYYAFNGYDPDTQEGRVFLARSDNLGSSWTVTELPRIERDLDAGELGRDALPSVAVDPDDPDSVHVAWTSNWAAWTVRPLFEDAGLEYYWDVTMRPYVASSTDGGVTFGDPVMVAEDLWLTETVEGMKGPPELLVGNDGELMVFFGESARVSEDGTREEPGEETAPASVYMAVSRDGGASFEGTTVYTEPPPTRGSVFLWSPRPGIDRTTGNLYVVWEQLSNAGQPVSILVSRSTDGGASWSEAIQVNDGPWPRTWTYMELMPSLSVAPNGRVDVAWFDPRNDPTVASEQDAAEGEEPDDDNAFHDVYYAYSTDQGQTWSSDVRITDRLIDRRLGAMAVGGIHGPLGLASVDGGAYIAWHDTRNATEESPNDDIYFARARHLSSEEFFGSAANAAGTHRLVGGVMGAGAALLLGGALLLLTGRSSAHRGEASRERA